MQKHESPKVWLNDEDCPRCGCWCARHFECNCGAVHADYCENCGRFTAPALTRDQYPEKDSLIPDCSEGPILHEHKHDYAKLIREQNKRDAS